MKYYHSNRRFNKATLRLRSHPKFNVPVIGHWSNESIRFESILDAEEMMDINYHNIFDACIGRTKFAGFARWEYVDGKHWIKYHAKQIVGLRSIMRHVGFNG